MAWGITDLTVSATSTGQSSQSSSKGCQPARWWNAEFFVYYVIMAASLRHMMQTTSNFSSGEFTLFRSVRTLMLKLLSESHPKYHKYAHKLHDGWLGRKMVWFTSFLHLLRRPDSCFTRQDLTDAQYRQFRAGLLPLIAVASVYLCASKLFRYFISKPERRITWFILPASLTFAFVLHGTSTLKMLILLSLNFIFAHLFAGIPYFGPAVGWAFNVFLLVSNKYFEGYPLHAMHPQLGAIVSDFKLLFRSCADVVGRRTSCFKDLCLDGTLRSTYQSSG